MATLTRPRVAVQTCDSDARHPLSLDIPTPFPRLPRQVDQVRPETQSTRETHREEQSSRTETSVEPATSLPERAAEEDVQVESADSVSLGTSPPVLCAHC